MMPEAFREQTSGQSADDIRFQFEIIKQLAESMREQTAVTRGMQEDIRTIFGAQSKTNERLAAIEANRVNETVAKLETKFETALERIDKLEAERDRQEGMTGARRAVVYYWPVIGIIFAAIIMLLSAVGIIHNPNQPIPEARR